MYPGINMSTDREVKFDMPVTLKNLRKLKDIVFKTKNKQVATIVLGKREMKEFKEYSKKYCRRTNNKKHAKLMPIRFDGISVIPVSAEGCMECFIQEEVDEGHRMMARFRLKSEFFGVLLVTMKVARRGKYAV